MTQRNGTLLVYERVHRATATTLVLGGVPEVFFREFRSALAVGDSCVYELFVVERSHRPHSLVETGLAMLSEGNVLTRTAILQGVNPGKPAVFESGDDAQWFVRMKDGRKLDDGKVFISTGRTGTFLASANGSGGVTINKVT